MSKILHLQSFNLVPFCSLQNEITPRKRILNSLFLNTYQYLPIVLLTNQSIIHQESCSLVVTQQVFDSYKFAIENHLFWVLKYKDLDIYEQIGVQEDGKYFVKSNWNFQMYSKESRVLKLLTLNGEPQDYTQLEVNSTIQFTYSSYVEYWTKPQEHIKAMTHRKLYIFITYWVAMLMIILIISIFLMKKPFGTTNHQLDEETLTPKRTSLTKLPDNNKIRQFFVIALSNGIGLLFTIITVFFLIYNRHLNPMHSKNYKYYLIVYLQSQLLNGYFSAKFSNIFVKKQRRFTIFLSMIIIPSIFFASWLIVNIIKIFSGYSQFFSIQNIFINIVFFAINYFIFNFGVRMNKESISEQESKDESKPKNQKIDVSRLMLRITIFGMAPFGISFVPVQDLMNYFWDFDPVLYWAPIFALIVLLFGVISLQNISFILYQLPNLKQDWLLESFIHGSAFGFYWMIYSVVYFNYSIMRGFDQLLIYMIYQTLICVILSIVGGTFAMVTTYKFVLNLNQSFKLE